MTKISNWLRNGKGRGLLLSLHISLFVAIIFAGMSFILIKTVTSTPQAQEFIQEFPQLTFKDGVMQNDVVWARPLPIPGIVIPVVIDSSRDYARLPLDPGVYITRLGITSYDGTSGEQWAYNPKIEKLILPDFINTLSVQLPIAIGLFVMIVYWIGFLLTALLATFLAWLAKVPNPYHRAWRVACVTYAAIGFILFVITLFYVIHHALLLAIMYPWIALSALTSTVILYLLKEKEI